MTSLGRSEELVSRCVECDLAEPESLASLGGSAPGVVDGILSGRKRKPLRGSHFLRTLLTQCTGAIIAQVDNVKFRRRYRPSLPFNAYRHRRKK